jgi:hypothetical protein
MYLGNVVIMVAFMTGTPLLCSLALKGPLLIFKFVEMTSLGEGTFKIIGTKGAPLGNA